LKQLKHLKHTLATYAGADSRPGLGGLQPGVAPKNTRNRSSESSPKQPVSPLRSHRILPPAQASDASSALNVKIRNSTSSRSGMPGLKSRPGPPQQRPSADGAPLSLVSTPAAAVELPWLLAGHCLPLLGRPNLQRHRVNIPCLPQHSSRLTARAGLVSSYFVQFCFFNEWMQMFSF
jgi:hypothetical protein